MFFQIGIHFVLSFSILSLQQQSYEVGWAERLICLKIIWQASTAEWGIEPW